MPGRSRAVLAPTKTRMNGLTTGWPPTASHDLVALSRDVPHLAEVDRAPVGDCFTDHKAAAQCVVRIGFEGAIRHLLHAVDVKPEGEELDRRNGVNSQSYLLIGVRLGTRREIAIGAEHDLGFPDADA